MSENDIRDRYFSWLTSKVRVSIHYKLLRRLFDIPFRSMIALDDNRIEDGIDLRYTFADEEGIDDRKIACALDSDMCSVLEVMIALSVRCEDRIMHDPDFGDRTSHWFWNMIRSLQLDGITDVRYDQYKIDRVIEIFLNREYQPDGTGGLYSIPGIDQDMRTIEIWYQMNLYLNTFYPEGV